LGIFSACRTYRQHPADFFASFSCKLPFLATPALAFSYAILALEKLQESYNIPSAPKPRKNHSLARRIKVYLPQRHRGTEKKNSGSGSTTRERVVKMKIRHE
jgi:hypothetical protein